MLPPRGFSRSPKFSAKAICWSSVMSWPWNTSTAYLSMPASISAASSLVSGLRRSMPETSPTKCLVSCRIAIAIAFPPDGGLSRLICPKSYSRGRRCQRCAGMADLRIARHQAAVDGNDGAGQEGRGRQAQAQGHVRDFRRLAVAAECGAALGIDGLVLLGNPVGDGGADRARADAVHGDALAPQLDRERARQARDAALGGGIGAVQRGRAKRLGGGDIDDAR